MAKKPARKKPKPQRSNTAPREAPNGADPELPTPTESESEWDGIPLCNVCDKPQSAECEHLMSSWEYYEEAGSWTPNTNPMALRDTVVELVGKVSRSFSEDQLSLVVALLRFPTELLAPLAESLADNGFASWEWTQYLARLCEASPSFAGTSRGETCGCGSSSVWTCYWDRNVPKAARGIERQFEKALRTLQQIAKMAKRLPPVDQE